MMRSPFSKIAARSRISWSLRKSSQSEESEVSIHQPVKPDHCLECTAEKMVKNDALMESLYVLLDQDHPDSPLYHSPFKIKNSDVAKWADSVSPFVSSPTELALPDNGNHHKSNRKSTSTFSSAGSLLSESSSNEDSKGPKTPTFSAPADWPLRKGLSKSHVGLAAKPINLGQPATNKAEPKIHRAFSFELVPEAPIRLPTPSNNTRTETAANTSIESSNTPQPPLFSTASGCQATITTLLDDFMPGYIPSPQITPAKKKSSFPLLRIDTRGFHTPIHQIGQPDIPEIELSPPAINVGEMLSLGYKAYSESRSEQDRALLSFSEREVSSSRHSIAHPPPKNNLNYDDYRKGATRYSVQTAPSKRLLNDLQEQKLFIPTKYKPYSAAPQPILRRSPAEVELHMSLEQNPAPVNYIPYSAPKIIRKRTPAEIEAALPIDLVPAPLQTKREERVAFPTNRDVFLTGAFVAKEQGLQLKMKRIVTTFSKMEWVIEDLSGLRRLKCFAQTNSLSRRKDFLDLEGNLLFDFQKKIGSTRIAETPGGAEVFSVQNASLPSMPHWTIKLKSSIDGSAAQWDARGDELMQTVVVSQAGVEVGRIRCESKQRKHIYIVSIAAEINYAVMAALTTVFDDLRTDEGC